MTVIKVNPESIHTYGKKAQKHFDDIRHHLQVMADEADRVPYAGNNAEKFKAETARLLSEYSKAMLKDLGTIADAIRVTTSNIAQSLGGQPITISVNGTPIVPQPVKKGDGTHLLDTERFLQLPGKLTANFDAIDNQLAIHLRSLTATVWEGKAKHDCVQLVGDFTNTAKKDTAEAKRSVIDYITKQTASAIEGDMLRGQA